MSLAVRPSFAFDVALPSADVVERLAALLSGGELPLRRTRVPGGGGEHVTLDRDHMILTVPAADQRIWSPWLTIEVEPRDAATHVFARFGPHPSVWTGFAFAYLTLGVVVVLSLVFTGAVAITGGTLWPLWVLGGASLAIGALWWASQLGKRLSQTQMQLLRAALERAIDAMRVAPAPATPPA